VAAAARLAGASQSLRLDRPAMGGRRAAHPDRDAARGDAILSSGPRHQGKRVSARTRRRAGTASPNFPKVGTVTTHIGRSTTTPLWGCAGGCKVRSEIVLPLVEAQYTGIAPGVSCIQDTVFDDELKANLASEMLPAMGLHL
jgi:hypothetical protein